MDMHTINITYIREILSNCPNYDYIINYNYDENDILTSKLIDWYRELIFSARGEDESQLQIIRALDHSLYLYVKDVKYKRKLRHLLSLEDISFTDKSLIKDAIKKIILFTNNYEKELILDVSSSKWI